MRSVDPTLDATNFTSICSALFAALLSTHGGAYATIEYAICAANKRALDAALFAAASTALYSAHW